MESLKSFFKRITGLTPTPEQEQLMDDLQDLKVKKLIISAGRQSGKTLICAVATLWYCFVYPNSVKILLVSAQESVLYYHIREIFKKNPWMADDIIAKGVYDLVPMRGFETNNGDIVSVRGSTDKQVRGLPADIAFIDEAADIKDDIILTAMGNLSGQISKYILISTPHKEGLFVSWASEPDKLGFKLNTWSSEGLPWHDPEIDKMKKQSYSKAKYAIEMLGRPPKKSERAFFPKKHLDKCLVRNIMPEGGVREAGLDFGSSVGKNILTISEKNGIRRKVLYQKHFRKPIEEALEEIGKTLTKYKVQIVKADSKPASYKQAIGNKINGVKVAYIDARFHKDNMLGQLQRHIRRHTIEIDRKQVPLILELQKYRKGKRSGDDRVDSLALSIYEYPYSTKPRGKVLIGKRH